MPNPLLSEINREVFAGDKYPLRHFVKEVGELIAACVSCRPGHIRAEASQVVFDIQHFIYCHTGCDFRPVLCGQFVNELYIRLGVWINLFGELGLVFRPKYLRGGSNYKRPDKVELAVSMARLEQA